MKKRTEEIGIFDMVEICVTCPGAMEMLYYGLNAPHSARFNITPFGRYFRTIGVHAGITLYNLHRVLCYANSYKEEFFELPLHSWYIEGVGQNYGNGAVFRKEARRRKDLLTDKTVSLAQFLRKNGALIYELGGLVFQLQISDILSGKTAQQDLLWVPRVCEGSQGPAPPAVVLNHPSFVASTSSIRSLIIASLLKWQKIDWGFVSEGLYGSHRIPQSIPPPPPQKGSESSEGALNGPDWAPNPPNLPQMSQFGADFGTFLENMPIEGGVVDPNMDPNLPLPPPIEAQGSFEPLQASQNVPNVVQCAQNDPQMSQNEPFLGHFGLHDTPNPSQMSKLSPIREVETTVEVDLELNYPNQAPGFWDISQMSQNGLIEDVPNTNVPNTNDNHIDPKLTKVAKTGKSKSPKDTILSLKPIVSDVQTVPITDQHVPNDPNPNKPDLPNHPIFTSSPHSMSPGCGSNDVDFDPYAPYMGQMSQNVPFFGTSGDHPAPQMSQIEPGMSQIEPGMSQIEPGMGELVPYWDQEQAQQFELNMRLRCVEYGVYGPSDVERLYLSGVIRSSTEVQMFLNMFPHSHNLDLNSSLLADAHCDRVNNNTLMPNGQISHNGQISNTMPPLYELLSSAITPIAEAEDILSAISPINWSDPNIDCINRVLSQTRFGKNLAVSRKSKRTRIATYQEESSRLSQFRLPIRQFFTQCNYVRVGGGRWPLEGGEGVALPLPPNSPMNLDLNPQNGESLGTNGNVMEYLGGMGGCNGFDGYLEGVYDPHHLSNLPFDPINYPYYPTEMSQMSQTPLPEAPPTPQIEYLDPSDDPNFARYPEIPPHLDPDLDLIITLPIPIPPPPGSLSLPLPAFAPPPNLATRPLKETNFAHLAPFLGGVGGDGDVMDFGGCPTAYPYQSQSQSHLESQTEKHGNDTLDDCDLDSESLLKVVESEEGCGCGHDIPCRRHYRYVAGPGAVVVTGTPQPVPVSLWYSLYDVVEEGEFFE